MSYKRIKKFWNLNCLFFSVLLFQISITWPRILQIDIENAFIYYHVVFEIQRSRFDCLEVTEQANQYISMLTHQNVRVKATVLRAISLDSINRNLKKILCKGFWKMFISLWSIYLVLSKCCCNVVANTKTLTVNKSSVFNFMILIMVLLFA